MIKKYIGNYIIRNLITSSLFILGNTSQSSTSLSSEDALNNYKNYNSEKINLNKISESFYEIQIAASLNPLSKNKIRKFEKFYKENIKENKINEIYKYSVKQFKTLEEALGFRNSLNSENNLGIIVYKNDKIVETKWNNFKEKHL